MDKTDADSSFYHNIFENSQSRLQKARVSKGSKKKSFATKEFFGILVLVLRFEDRAALYPPRRNEDFKNDFSVF